MAENCIFCKIVQKEADASFVYEDEQVIAFMDIRPVSEGHTLVITKQHFVDIFDIPETLISKLQVLTKRVALAVKKVTNADGISVVQQNGKAAGQDIFHIHVHIIPRFEGQKMPQFGELRVQDRENLEDVAIKIRKYI